MGASQTAGTGFLRRKRDIRRAVRELGAAVEAQSRLFDQLPRKTRVVGVLDSP